MDLIRLTTADDNLYPAAMDLYRISFPYHEQREEPSQRNTLLCDDYHFDLIYDGTCFVGIILYWETQSFLYVEHFCIEPQMRNKRYGQKALQLLAEKGKPIILEIDPPVDPVSIKRKAFYERQGYRENSYQHVHPPYHPENTGHLLTVLSYPHELAPAEYEAFRSYLNHTVMGLEAEG